LNRKVTGGHVPLKWAWHLAIGRVLFVRCLQQLSLQCRHFSVAN